MKQCIKYLIAILLGVLMYGCAMQAADIPCTPVNHATRCILSQAPTTQQQVIRNIFNHLSSVSLYMDNVDCTKVPANKSILLLMNCFRMCWRDDSLTLGALAHSPYYLVPDPLSYYVFGLRKIII